MDLKELWEFKTVLLYLHPEFGEAEFRYNNPVWVHAADNKIVGAAHLSTENNTVFAQAYIDYHTPERLSVEAGDQLFLDPICNFHLIDVTEGDGSEHLKVSDVATIVGLKFSNHGLKGIPPIGKGVL